MCGFPYFTLFARLLLPFPLYYFSYPYFYFLFHYRFSLLFFLNIFLHICCIFQLLLLTWLYFSGFKYWLCHFIKSDRYYSLYVSVEFLVIFLSSLSYNYLITCIFGTQLNIANSVLRILYPFYFFI